MNTTEQTDRKPDFDTYENLIAPELYALLKQYVRSEDILEDPNFDAIAYLNEKFPDFDSLENLPEFIASWEKQLSELDEELDVLMCERAKYSEEMKSYMAELNNDVQRIVDLIGSIKKNADINETTVKMICNDIKSLDNARNNLTITISSLTKLIILITGIENLEKSVKAKNYKDAANEIAASNDILNYFEEYRHITQIYLLYQKKENLCSSLLASIMQEFKNNISSLPSNADRLYEACMALNAMGDSQVNTLKNWFIQFKLMPYDEIFDPNKVSDRIEFDDTERRFEWIKRVLMEYNQKYENVFLPSWGFKAHLCQEFCRMTKVHLHDLLSSNFENNKAIDVDILVRVLNNTIDFENNMNSYLVHEYEGLQSDSQSTSKELLALSTQGNSIEEIRAKYEDSNRPVTRRFDPNKSPKYDLFRVKGVISESFEPYMISYVNIEEQKLLTVINQLKATDKLEGKLWISSLHLFKNIQQGMNRCLSFSKAKTLYDLSLMFNEIFKCYNNSILRTKIRYNREQ